MSIGQKIKKLRQEKKLTQKQLSEMVGCAVTTVSGWEIGTNRAPGKRFLVKVAKVLGVTLEYLVNEYQATQEEKTIKYILPVYASCETDGFIWENFSSQNFLEVTEKEYSAKRFVLKIQDSKMAPLILGGDYCIFEKQLPKDDDVAVINFPQQGNQTIVKKWREFENFIILEGTNPYLASNSYRFVLQRKNKKALSYIVRNHKIQKIVVKGVLRKVRREI